MARRVTSRAAQSLITGFVKDGMLLHFFLFELTNRRRLSKPHSFCAALPAQAFGLVIKKRLGTLSPHRLRCIPRASLSESKRSAKLNRYHLR